MGCASSKSDSGEGMTVNQVDNNAGNQPDTDTVGNELKSEDDSETFKEDLSETQSKLERKASYAENNLNEKEENTVNQLEKKVNNIDCTVDDIEDKADQQVNEAERNVKRKTDGIETDIDDKVNSLTTGTNLDQNNGNTTDYAEEKGLRYSKKMEVTVVDTGTDDLANKVGKKRKMVKKESQEGTGNENESLNDSVYKDENEITQNNESANTEEVPNNSM